VKIAFDSNVLVYATGPAGDPKCERAREIINRASLEADGVMLVQALAEYSHVAIRKARIPAAKVRIIIELWGKVFSVEAASHDDLAAALGAVEEHRLAFWDAMLWATAQRVGVRYLLTEDLQDGRNLGGVRFVNPFAAANRSAIERILTR
jgi:predicted nucleic acid-binding protein